MESVALTAVVEEELAVARLASSGRAARTIHGGHLHALRQTLIALVSGRALAEHESPGEATLQVLLGQVRLTAGDESWEGGPGDFVIIPPTRHRLDALQDSAVLLSVVTAAPK